MLLGKEALIKILEENDLETFSKLDQRWFLDREESREYQRCVEYLQRYGRLPPASFIEALEDIRDHPPQFFIEALTERYKKYWLGNIAEAINGEADLDQINSMISSYIFDKVHYIDDGTVTSENAITMMQAHVDKVRENYLRSGLSGLPTGWPSLDESTGGYQEGDISVFSGRAKTGKTMLMIYSLNHLLEHFEDIKILFLSMEMTTIQVLTRLACLRAQVNTQSLRIGDISTLAERRLVEALPGVMDKLIISEGKMDRDVASLVGMIGTVQPDIVFIDGAYLIRTQSNALSSWEKVKEVIETLKGIAVNFKVPIVCSYQLRRGVKKSEPDLEHLALSDAIGQVASMVLGIVDIDVPDTRKIEIMGVREGVKDSFFINWSWDRFDFTEKDFTQ